MRSTPLTDSDLFVQPMSNKALLSPWWSRMTGLLLVLALHAGALGWLWRQQIALLVDETAAVFVSFVASDQAEVAHRPKPVAAAKFHTQPTEPEPPKFISVATSVPSSAEFAAPVMPAQLHAVPATVTPPAPAKVLTDISAPQNAGPLALATELSVICPQRAAPTYPLLSRRLGESGTVLLRVELNADGDVTDTQVQGSSGYARLDNAALNAVRSWRCTPASRQGQAVRATALQPFHFVIQGN